MSLHEEALEPSGTIELNVRRQRGHTFEETTDHVGQEWPVAIVVNGISHAVMMCTPCDLEAFAVGFARSEGIVSSGAEIQDIEVMLYEDGPTPYAEVQLTVIQEAFANLKEKRRSMAGRSGCGVCGIESVALLDLDPERVPDLSLLDRLAPDASHHAAACRPPVRRVSV